MMKTRSATLIATMTAVLLLSAGCDEDKKPGQVQNPPAATNQQTKNPVVPENQKIVSTQTEIKL